MTLRQALALTPVNNPAGWRWVTGRVETGDGARALMASLEPDGTLTVALQPLEDSRVGRPRGEPEVLEPDHPWVRRASWTPERPLAWERGRCEAAGEDEDGSLGPQ